MELTSRIKLSGRVQIWDMRTGALLRDTHNIVTCGGCAFVAGYMSGGAMTQMQYLGVGASATAAVTADTALESEISDGNRHTAVISAPTSTSVKLSASWGAGHHTGNWQEVGIFNATSAGLMYSRSTFGILTKAAGDAFVIEYTISFADDGA